MQSPQPITPWVHEPDFPVVSTTQAQPADRLLLVRLLQRLDRHSLRLVRIALVCLALGAGALLGGIVLRHRNPATWELAGLFLPHAITVAAILLWLYGVLLLLVGLKGQDLSDRIRQNPQWTVARLANRVLPYHRLQDSLRYGQWAVWIGAALLALNWAL